MSRMPTTSYTQPGGGHITWNTPLTTPLSPPAVDRRVQFGALKLVRRVHDVGQFSTSGTLLPREETVMTRTTRCAGSRYSVPRTGTPKPSDFRDARLPLSSFHIIWQDHGI